MQTLLRPAITLFTLLSLITGVIYPIVVTGIAQIFFPEAANGSLIIKDGKIIGAQLIGQNFTDPQYFWGRPSATAGQPYNGIASGGSNLGPLNPALINTVKERMAMIKAADPNHSSAIPLDLVTTSASGLDPHISPATARYQLARIAKTRGRPPEKIATLIDTLTEGPQWRIFGEARVNVLLLNLALDQMR